MEFYKLHQHFISTLELTMISREIVVSSLPKFMQTLDDIIYRELEKIAKRRGITIQELIRAVIVPEWINGLNGVEGKDSVSNKLNNWR
ncbi:MAG TPA: hypothetical protein VNW25_02185 [Candidatus Sulfotelmatobacter sp.]|nr:hypothetical protein [Candidatus Sulfotelmatobacter sp.]